jgi:hypothetical protein
MMKLSDRMKDYAIEDEKMTDNTIVKQWADEVAQREAKNERLVDELELAWGIIANAGGGDWETQTKEWQDAATRWRDRYHSS